MVRCRLRTSSSIGPLRFSEISSNLSTRHALSFLQLPLIIIFSLIQLLILISYRNLNLFLSLNKPFLFHSFSSFFIASEKLGFRSSPIFFYFSSPIEINGFATMSMSLSDDSSSSYGGEYKNLKQISRESKFLFHFLLIILIFWIISL